MCLRTDRCPSGFSDLRSSKVKMSMLVPHGGHILMAMVVPGTFYIWHVLLVPVREHD